MMGLARPSAVQRAGQGTDPGDPRDRITSVRGSIPLSPRQREVATLVREDVARAEIARRLGIAERTVEVHLALVRRRTGRQTLAAAIADLVASGSL